jgi:exonuclease V gamma subunit
VIDLSYSNRTEPLLDALAENVAATQATLYDPVCLLVPNGFVEGYVKQGLARRRGIAAHIETRFLKGFLRDVAEASEPGLRVVDRDVIEGQLLALFHDSKRLALAELAPVRGYLSPDDSRDDGDRLALDRRRAQLAAKLAELFDEYGYSRPEMLAAWRKGGLIAGSASCGWRSSAAPARCPGARRRRSPISSRAPRPPLCACPARRTSSGSRSSRGCIDRSSRRSGARRRCSSTR